MKKIFLTAALFAFAGIICIAQETKSVKNILELKIPGPDGSNGAQVAWHPIEKKYYAAMAGNTTFSMGVYDATGKLLSPTDQQTLFDIRGLWYNPGTKSLQMNGYDDFGWAEYKLNSQGIPVEFIQLHEGLHQPDVQSSGAFDAREKAVYFFTENGSIEKYGFTEGEYLELIEIALGKTQTADTDKSFSKSNPDVIDEYNTSTVIYTGISGAEVGLLNLYKKQVELYNLSTGYMTRKILLPTDAPTSTMLNFSYCNGVYWLFNKQTRVWMGYK